MAKKRAALAAGTRGYGRRKIVVKREERVGPTPETLAKLRPWSLPRLVAEGKLSHDQFEAAIDIVSAFRFVTRVVGFKPLDLERIASGHGDIGARGERTFAIYRTWGNAVQGVREPGQRSLLRPSLYVRPHVIVEMIEDDRIIDNDGKATLLAKACTYWREIAADYDKAKAAAKTNRERHTIMTVEAVASAIRRFG